MLEPNLVAALSLNMLLVPSTLNVVDQAGMLMQYNLLIMCMLMQGCLS